MFTRSADGATTSVTVRPPLVYLDHCGLRNISRDTTLREEFVSVFSERGTLLFSLMNFLEPARNSGKSHADICAFLDRLGPHWIPCEIDPEAIIKAEAAGVPSPGNFMMRMDLLSRVLKAATDQFLLGTALAKLNAEEGFRERAPQLLAGGPHREQLIEGILQARRRHQRGEKFPALKIPKSSARWIQIMLARRFASSGKKVVSNEINDLFHAIVALAAAHIIVLDKAWAEFGRSLKLEDTIVFSCVPAQLRKTVQAIRNYEPSRVRTIRA